MRIAGLLAFLLVSLVMAAQNTPTKIKTVPVSATSAASGKEMFVAYCASCHGLDGRGKGPAAAALNRAPADLTVLTHNHGGKYPSMLVMSSIQDGTESAHGSKDMPVWGPILSSVSTDRPMVVNQRLANLTGYIETLQAR